MLKFFEGNSLIQNLSSWSTAALEQARTTDFDWANLSFDAKVRAGESLYHACIKAARLWIGAELHEIHLNDGVVRYWKTHKPHRETILFLHGFADSKDGCYSLAVNLANEYNVMALDLPGFGESFRRPDLAHNFESYGRWLDEFARKSGMGSVHVVGNSLGGAMALSLGLRRPELVKSISLLNTAGIIDYEKESLYDAIMRGENIFQVQTLEQFEKFWSKVFYRQPFLPPFGKEFLFQRFKDNHDWYGQLVRMNFGSYSDKTDPAYQALFLNHRLASITAPSLIIWGDRDQLFPTSFGEKGHALLKDSKLVVLKDVGHAPHVEAPMTVARHLKRFIRELPGKHTKAAPGNS